MLTAPIHQLRPPPHVIVVGNEKGGSGKTTIAMHVAVALLKAGQRVATIDLDGRQRTLTRHIENRRGWARRKALDLALPTHFCIARVEGARVEESEAAEFSDFQCAVAAAQECHDFIVIDTPPHDSYLMRLAHSATDTLLTPLNDSFLDLDVLAKLDPVTLTVAGLSHYAELVRETRRHRRPIDGAFIDWVIARNRVSPRETSATKALGSCLQDLALAAGFRVVTGLHERPVYRDLFPYGLTALDEACQTMSDIGEETRHLPARSEINDLLEAMKLPINDRGRRRAALRAEWSASHDATLDTGDILADS